METATPTTELEYLELASTVARVAERAPIADPAELIELWPAVEQRVLDRVSADGTEREHATQERANAPRPDRSDHSDHVQRSERLEGERIRNLAWEIGVSIDLRAVHLGALGALAKVLRERGQRLGRRATRNSNRRSHASRPESNAG